MTRRFGNDIEKENQGKLEMVDDTRRTDGREGKCENEGQKEEHIVTARVEDTGEENDNHLEDTR